MDYKLLGFFSGFPDGFPWDVAGRLREELTERGSLVMIASELSKHEKVDRYAAQWRGWFEDIGLPFEDYHTIDDRMEPAQAVRLVEETSCVILMGGDPAQQMRFLRDTGLDEALCKTSAAILGLSAGAVNMAARSLGIWESRPPRAGLGLANITVYPHYDPSDEEALAELLRISETLPICAMEDDSAIFISGERVSSMGEIHIIDRGRITPAWQGGLLLYVEG
ncbi:MAG: Type 1 glutamine amidotransferase-like domain-containing protein [Firmicutes bacterium]|nr:Type 1 glutamine amidotransferase-like domain-containing protein [Bacillota bacterium]